MKKIIIPTLGLTAHGGVRVLVEVANRLVSRECDVTIIIPNRPTVSPFVLDNRVVVKKIGPLTNSKYIAGLYILLISPIYLVNRHVLANHFVTVFPAWLSTCISRSKYFYFVQDIEYRFYKGGFFGFIKILCEWTYRRGRLIAANSYLASELEKYEKALLSLELGVAETFFSTPNISTSKEYDIVYFLRKETHKRIDRFNILLPMLLAKEYRILCISQDVELLHAYENKVKTLCPESDDEIIAALDKSKILLLTSDHEGFSLPPLEAMARGLPSVIFECGGPAIYAIHEINSMIVFDGKESVAFEYVEKLLTDDVFYSELSSHCLVTASRFKLEEAVSVLSNYLIEAY